MICHHYAGYLSSTVVWALGCVELANVRMGLRKRRQEERKRLIKCFIGSIKFYWFAVEWNGFSLWLCTRQMVTIGHGKNRGYEFDFQFFVYILN